MPGMRCGKCKWWPLGLLVFTALLGGGFQGRERFQGPRQDGPPAPGRTARTVTPQAVAGPSPVPLPQAQGKHPAAPGLSPEPAPAARVQMEEAYGKLPLHFEANQGQADAQVPFLARGKGYTLFLTATEAVLTLRNGEKAEGGRQSAAPAGSSGQSRNQQSGSETPQSAVVRLQLLGANPAPQVRGQAELPGKVNYFRGTDPTQWRTNIPTYARVHYQDVYPGVDLVYYGNQRQLEYDFIVAPGADPAAIRLAVAGADTLDIDAQGDLHLRLAGGEVRLPKPRVYQEVDGVRHEIPGGYVLNPQSEIGNPKSRVVGFQVAAYDPGQPLVIDPVLSYSTYLGGGSNWDFGNAIAVDAAGSAYVTGRTESRDFPTTPGAFQPTHGGYYDAFVTKLNPTGATLVYSTYLGGRYAEFGSGIAVDAAGSAYVTGRTESRDFPTTPGAFQPIRGGESDAFVTKLNPTGTALVYSTYLGGSLFDRGNAIAVDATGNAYVTGETTSTDFPTTPGAFQPTHGGYHDAFVTKLSLATGPGLGLRLNGTAFRSGEQLILSATVTPGPAPVTADVYVAVQLPDGILLFLLGDGSISPILQPIVQSFPISPFSGQIFAYTFTGGEPGGNYAWLAAFTQPGTLTFIGPIVSAPFGFST